MILTMCRRIAKITKGWFKRKDRKCDFFFIQIHFNSVKLELMFLMEFKFF